MVIDKRHKVSDGGTHYPELTIPPGFDAGVSVGGTESKTLTPAPAATIPLSKEAALVNDVLKALANHPSWPYVLSKPRPARKQLARAIAKTITRWPIGKRVAE